MPFSLASVSYAVKSIIHCTIEFLKLRQLAVQQRCNMAFLVIQCHWCWHQCHMMPMVTSMAPLHSQINNKQNEVQHVNVDFSSCFYINQICFLSNRTNFVERDKLSTGYSWLHQVLKKMFSIVNFIHIKCIRKCLSK